MVSNLPRGTEPLGNTARGESTKRESGMGEASRMERGEEDESITTLTTFPSTVFKVSKVIPY
jgi:hypothetical protein